MGIPQRGEKDVGPEARAVFADSQSFFFGLSGTSDFCQVVLRLAALHVFLRIKQGEVFSNDFFRAVAHETGGSGVPTDDVAGRVQLENSILLHSLNQQAEPLLALAQCALRAPLFRDVFKNNAEKVVRKRKNLDSVDSFADTLIAVSDFSQIARLLCAQGFEAGNGQRSFQEPGKISQSFPAKI